jgi:lipoate synthase
MGEMNLETLIKKKLVETLEAEFGKLKESIETITKSWDDNENINVEELGRVYQQLDRLRLVVSKLITLSAEKDG